MWAEGGLMLPLHNKHPLLGLCANYWGFVGNHGAADGGELECFILPRFLAFQNDWCKGSCSRYLMNDEQSEFGCCVH